MTILEEVPAELASIASALHGAPVLAGFALARGALRVEVALAAPGRLRVRVERPDLFVAPPKPVHARSQAPYRIGQSAPAAPVIDKIHPVELALDTGDSEAPDGLRVETGLEPQELSHVLHPEVRSRAAALLAAGFSTVVLLRDGPAVEAERDIEEGLPADSEMVRAGIDRVSEIAEALPVIATRARYRKARARDLRALWWFVPAFLLVALVAEYVSWSFINPIGNFAGILIGLGVALTLGPIAVVIQMRRGHTVQAAFSVFLWIALVAPLGLQSGMMFVNCRLAPGTVEPWHAKVDRLLVRTNKGNEYYEVVLERRQPKQLPVKLSIDDETYALLKARPEASRILILDVRRGVLNLDWYTKVELAP